MAMTKAEIIAAIEHHAATAGVSPATVTGRAVGNSRLYSRMMAGGGCTVDVAERLLNYIADNSAAQPPEDAA
ncbi:hypothetical protein [Paracoccus aminophilus]|uniref:hypothetical protein n=1 Tax=Paracoccus aminophilus TaxID=34003 RepID=UPI001F26C709|nr:hypothetical protein [Paracoccus aminophilus]